MAPYSELSPGVLEVEPELAVCKASTLPTVLSLWPQQLWKLYGRTDPSQTPLSAEIGVL